MRRHSVTDLGTVPITQGSLDVVLASRVIVLAWFQSCTLPVASQDVVLLLMLNEQPVQYKVATSSSQVTAFATSSDNVDAVIWQIVEQKGLDIVRRDWCPLSKDCGNFALRHILSGEPRDAVVAAIHEHLEKVMCNAH